MDRPRILLPMNFRDAVDDTPDQAYLNDAYVRLILDNGGLPVLAAPSDSFDADLACEYRPDGLLLTGGADLDPGLYDQPPHPKRTPLHPRREAAELAWFAWAEREGLPILGICLGCQIINVARGGTLIQYLPDLPDLLDHRRVGVAACHDVSVFGPTLRAVIGDDTCTTNSTHRQAVDRLGRGLRLAARATDGVVEAIEDADGRFIVGVQWHPESLPGEPATRAMAAVLVNAAASRKQT
jgi:putative glutamine amidotransferase